MKSKPSGVLIPLGSPGGQGAVAVIEAKEMRERPDIRGFDPMIARLADVELHVAGQKALEQFNWLRPRLPRHRFRLTRPVAPPVELVCTNASAVRGLSRANSSSAELALLLAMLGQGRAFASYDLVAATGVLADDGTIGTVRLMPEKCAALADWVARQVFEAPFEFLFVTPELAPEDVGLIVSLRASCADANVTLHHVEATDAAGLLARIGVATPNLDRREIAARSAAAAGTVCAGLAAILVSWSWTSPVLSFASASWTIGDPLQTPLSARISRSAASAVPLSTCYDNDQRLLVAFDDHLVVRAQLSKQRWLDGSAWLYDVAVVVLGEASRPLVFSGDVLPQPDRLAQVDGGLGFGAAIPAEAPEEAMKIVVLARKLWPINTARLEAKLDDAYTQGPEGEQRLTRQANVVSRFAQARLFFDYRVVRSVEGCAT